MLCRLDPIFKCFVGELRLRKYQAIAVVLDPSTGSVQVFLIELYLQFVAVPRDTRDLIFSIEVFALKVALEFVQGRNLMTAELEKKIYPSDCANDNKRS